MTIGKTVMSYLIICENLVPFYLVGLINEPIWCLIIWKDISFLNREIRRVNYSRQVEGVGLVGDVEGPFGS